VICWHRIDKLEFGIQKAHPIFTGLHMNEQPTIYKIIGASHNVKIDWKRPSNKLVTTPLPPSISLIWSTKRAQIEKSDKDESLNQHPTTLKTQLNIPQKMIWIPTPHYSFHKLYIWAALICKFHRLTIAIRWQADSSIRENVTLETEAEDPFLLPHSNNIKEE